MSYSKTKALYEAMQNARLTFNTLEVMFPDVEDEQYQNGERDAALIAQEVEDEYYTDEQKEEDATNLCLYTRN